MFTRNIIGKLNSRAVRILTLLIVAVMISSAHSDVIKENEVEDLNLIVSQFVFGQPNALFIMDVSGSMGRNFGGTQIGRWTPDSDLGTIQDCLNGLFYDDSDNARVTHCAENTANLTECGSIHCKNGTCDEVEEFENLKQCVYNHPDSSITSDSLASFIFDSVCGLFCNDSDEREAAAAALESAAGLTTCASNTPECHNWEFDGSPACNTPLDFSTWRDECMMVLQDIEINREANCTAMDDAGNLVNENCSGRPAHGSSRLDVTLSVIFDLLDADNSLDDSLCSDDEGLFDGTSPISCKDYMNTPFRNVRSIARDDGGQESRLPISGNSGDDTLINYLTDNDAEELSIRLRPLTYSGLGNWSGCTANSTFNLAQGGFAGASETSFKNVWRFFRRLEPDGGTPLAYVLGFDDSDRNGSQGGNVVNDDALGVFSTELQTDPSIECRPEFVIILTDGEDTCSGEGCSEPNAGPSCTGSLTTNANRRSVVQAVSNLRTYYVRNPVSNRGDNFKKEIMTFVIGLGIPEEDSRARRAINAMALVGGTHNEGIIQHAGPDGVTFGNVDINELFPNEPEFDVFKSLAKAEGLDSSDPSNARLQGCTMGNENENGTCSFNSTDIFNNDFFDNGTPLPNDKKLMDGFAFFPQNATELRATLEDIFAFIDTFTTAGVSPAAPQSSTSVALRNRIFLSILTPITDKRIWQGRLALYGFVDDPENEGNRIVVKDPGGVDLTEIDSTDTLINQYGIFDPDDGTLVKQRAQQFHWEAGKLLAERSLSSDPRNVLTINPDFDSTNSVKTSNGGVIRYVGDATAFNSSLPPETFGISDGDVTDPIPSFCTAEPPDGYADCNAGVNDCNEDISGDTCRACVKTCIRDKVVDFMIGNNDILPQGDPLGGPELAGTSDETNFETIGVNCPNPENDTGSFDTCSVRLGDIFHSDPIVVGSPSALFFDTGFSKFSQAFRDRSSSVYVGANDGGFHSFHAGELVEASPTDPQENPFTGADVELPFFDEGTGWEMFFYIPPTFLPDSIAPTSPLNKGPESHLDIAFPDLVPEPPEQDYRFGDLKTFVVDNLVQRSFFDGSPLIFDAFIDGYDNDIAPDSDFCPIDTGPAEADGEINECGKEWHTLAVAGYRNGGGAYTALDITNPHCTVGGTPEKCTSVGQFAANNNDGRFNGDGPEYPKHLWTVFDRNFGNTWSKPAPGRVRMKTKSDGEDVTVDRWLLFAGGGLDPVDTDPSNGVDFGNAFYAIDAATGQIVFKFHPSNPIPSTLTDNAIRQAMDCDMASSPGVFDVNNDGYIDLAYIGDTCGRLWRFDVSKAIVDTGNDVSSTGRIGNAVIEAPNWTADIAFCANTEAECGDVTSSPIVPQNNLQPIYFAPTLVIDDLGRKHVIFNTGSRRHPSSVDSFGKLFNIIDPYIPAFLAGGESGSSIEPTMYRTEDDFDSGEIIELVPQTGLGENSSPQFTTQGGSTINNQGQFVVVFPDNVAELSGEKGVGTPVVINRVLVFSTFAPDSGVEDNPCASKPGVGRVFALDYLTGDPALGRVPGADTLLSGTSDQKLSAAGLSVAEGIPSPARLTFGARGSVIMTVAFAGGPTTGGAQFLVWELPPFPSRTQTLFWEEIM